MRGLGAKTDRILLKENGRMGIYFVETGSNQRSSNVVYDRAHSCMSETKPEEYDFEKILDNVKWLHISGITPSLSEAAFLSTLEIVKQANELGVTISCDLNYRKKLWEWNPELSKTELARKCMEQIVPFVDVIIGNEEDASDVFAIHAQDSDIESGQINLDGYKSVARQLSEKFTKAKYIAITLRESISADHNDWGAMLYDTKAAKAFYAPENIKGKYTPYQIHNIVDRVGGGDSFAAGLIYALNNAPYNTPDQAIQFAVAASCLKHTIKGDFNYVSLKEVLSLMKGNTSGRVQR
jgi:2-dehydro-3-deoxygluconokinase